jgi:tRNA pseudouridine32 synthase/23S rRNA pseudouridine746 synthase
MMLNEDTVRCLCKDDHFYAIHKPAGVNFHCTDDHEGIVKRVKALFPEETLYPIHRLDKITSGLMIFARTSQVNRELSVQLAEKKIEKYYLALSVSKPTKKQGMVSGDMEKGRRGSYLLTRQKTNPAVTRFFARSIEPLFPKDGQERKHWLFVIKPETGKTHQIRVALKSVGSAVLGDGRYSPISADRGYLHAYKVRFDLYGQRYEITDPFFLGDYINLEDDAAKSVLGEYLAPETLVWPKGAFLLS